MRQNEDIDIISVCDEIINYSLAETIEKYNKGATVILESPVESYCFANSTSVKFLTEHGYKGVYVSFQRPYDNICNFFKKQYVDNNKVIILDCVNISSLDFDKICKKISISLKSIDCDKKFVLIDSLSTVALYKKGSEIEGLAKKLIGINDNNLLVLFNVADDLIKKQYVKNITSYADEVINVLNCVENYDKDVVDPRILT